MTTKIDWPMGLKPSIRATKSREETVGFREAPVTSGPSFIEPFSNDTPVFYDVQFIFEKGGARAFQSWLRINRMITNAPFFNFPIVIEDPNVETQQARFTLEGYPQLIGETGYTFTYAATLLIRNIVTEDEDYDNFILQLGEATGFMQDQFLCNLDIVLNSRRA